MVGPAFFLGLFGLLLFVTAEVLESLTPDWKVWVRFWMILGIGVILTSALDGLTSWLLPDLRSSWGVYLNLLAFSPLYLRLSPAGTTARPWSTALLHGLKMGGLFIVLLTGVALVRETLGLGSLTIVPHLAQWQLPLLSLVPLKIVSTGAGAFFLAALAVVVYRALRPALTRSGAFSHFWDTKPAHDPLPVPREKPVSAPKSETILETKRPDLPLAEPAGEWGETLEGVMASLGSNEPKRLLIVGSGNGELAYYLAILGLEQAKTDRNVHFRVRAVDHFSTRVEVALVGEYREAQLDFIPAALRQQWFLPGQGEARHLWRVGSEPRRLVEFEKADFQKGQVFFDQPAHLIVLNQGIEYVNDEKKAHVLLLVCQNLVPGGALLISHPVKRELLPEGMRRTGTTVFRRA